VSALEQTMMIDDDDDVDPPASIEGCLSIRHDPNSKTDEGRNSNGLPD
jgi:hypothetical protein